MTYTQIVEFIDSIKENINQLDSNQSRTTLSQNVFNK
jgi:hypothetical protein